MKVLVLGKNSQVGKSFPTRKNFIFLSRKQADITNFLNLKKIIKTISPDIIINLTAYNNVSKSETKYKDAFKINCGGVSNLLKIKRNSQFFLIHVSTDYVFSGKKNLKKTWKINSKRSPLNKYGLSKKLGEDEILKSKDLNCLIIRTSWVFSKYGDNFVKKILRLSKVHSKIDVVTDQFGAPTSALSLAKFLVYVVNNLSKLKNERIIHFCNKPYCNWFNFAKKIIKNKKLKVKIEPSFTNRNDTKLLRPKNSKLDYIYTKTKLSYTQERWEEYLKNDLQKINV